MHKRLYVPFTLVVSVIIALTAISDSQADTVAHYLALRHKPSFNPTLTLAQVKQDPGQYAGSIFELKGNICGFSQTGTQIYLILSLPSKESVILHASDKLKQETDLDSSVPMCVLIQDIKPVDSLSLNLKILSIADEPDVTAAEKQADADAQAAKIRASNDKSASRSAFQRSVPADLRGALSARGGYSRIPAGGVSGDALAQAAYYVPMLGSRTKALFVPYYQYIASRNPRLGDNLVGQITYFMLYDCEQDSLDPRLIVSMIIAESDFDPNCTSSKGAMGLCQLMPDDLKHYGLSSGYDIEQNLFGALLDIRNRLDHYRSLAAADGSLTDAQIKIAMASYNAGYGAVEKYGGVPPYKETQNYIKRILRYYHQFCGNN